MSRQPPAWRSNGLAPSSPWLLQVVVGRASLLSGGGEQCSQVTLHGVQYRARVVSRPHIGDPASGVLEYIMAWAAGQRVAAHVPRQQMRRIHALTALNHRSNPRFPPDL